MAKGRKSKKGAHKEMTRPPGIDLVSSKDNIMDNELHESRMNPQTLP